MILWCVWHRKISRYCENYLRNMASTMLANLEKTVNIQEEKFTSFEVSESWRQKVLTDFNCVCYVGRSDVVPDGHHQDSQQ